MSESNEKQAGFLGTYFDRDSVMRLSRWADVIAWIILTLYLLSWVVSLAIFVAQSMSGLFIEKGMTFLNALNILMPYFLQALPGVIYFFSLQAISKALLILLDMEDNTRRAARK